MVTTNSTTTEYQCEAQLPNVTLWNVCRLGRAAPLLQIWPEPVTYTITVTAPINAQLLSTETPRGQPAYALRVTDTHTHSLNRCGFTRSRTTRSRILERSLRVARDISTESEFRDNRTERVGSRRFFLNCRRLVEVRVRTAPKETFD